MKNLIFAILAVSLFSGCATTGTKNLEYSPYIGEQKFWETREATFAPKQIGQIAYYSKGTYPNKMYVITGRAVLTAVTVPARVQQSLSEYAKLKNVDAVIELYSTSQLSTAGSAISGIAVDLIKFLPDEWLSASEFASALKVWSFANSNKSGAAVEETNLSAESLAEAKANAEKKMKQMMNEYASKYK